jgi:hypothetical protein
MSNFIDEGKVTGNKECDIPFLSMNDGTTELVIVE